MAEHTGTVRRLGYGIWRCQKVLIADINVDD